MLAVFMLIGMTYSAVIPQKDIFRNEDWAEDYNLVEPPPSVMLLSQMFDSSKSKITPQNRLKSVIKALYHFDTMKNVHRTDENKAFDNFRSLESDLNGEEKIFSRPESSKEMDTEEDRKTILEEVKSEEFFNGESNEKNEKVGQLVEAKKRFPDSKEEEFYVVETTQKDVDVIEPTTQKSGVLLEDIVDSIIHVPAHMEADKTQKFTHSIRYGYGVPFHFNGL